MGSSLKRRQLQPEMPLVLELHPPGIRPIVVGRFLALLRQRYGGHCRGPSDDVGDPPEVTKKKRPAIIGFLLASL